MVEKKDRVNLAGKTVENMMAILLMDVCMDGESLETEKEKDNSSANLKEI